jgi:hypothetical protein
VEEGSGVNVGDGSGVVDGSGVFDGKTVLVAGIVGDKAVGGVTLGGVTLVSAAGSKANTVGSGRELEMPQAERIRPGSSTAKRKKNR